MSVITFNYQRRSDKESTLIKITTRIADLISAIALMFRHRPDIIHHNSAFDDGTIIRDGLLCFIAKLLRIPILVKIHGSHKSAFGEMGEIKDLARTSILRFSSGLGVLSEVEKQEFQSRWPLLNGRVHVVKNIIRRDFLDASVRDHGRPVVYFASRFIKEKGIFDLLESVSSVVAAIPESKFCFVGDGPDASEFKQRIMEQDLQDHVRYLPNQTYPELISLYEQGGIFVFPSHYPEGMPMALLEAMAVGLLAITSPIRFARCVPSFCDHSYLVLDDSSPYPPQIARAIIRVIKDKVLRETIGQSNKDFTASFSDERIAQDFVRLYMDIIKRN